MMDNVIKADFEPKKEHTLYEIHDDALRALRNKDAGLCIGSITPKAKSFMISLYGGETYLNRQELAEFLWMAAYMVDSEQRWCPRELPAINYDS